MRRPSLEEYEKVLHLLQEARFIVLDKDEIVWEGLLFISQIIKRKLPKKGKR